MAAAYRIGLIGHGYIGSGLLRSFEGTGVEVVSVYDHGRKNFEQLPPGLATADPDAFIDSISGLDLVVEVAHAAVSAEIGVRILEKTSYMPCSVVAIADEDLRRQLLATAKQSGTRLFIPHGAVVGLDNLLEARSTWKSASITFRKPAPSIDKSVAAQGGEALLFEGSAREIATKFPRSVNAMVACALATLGLDDTATRMYSDNRYGNVLRGEFEFVAANGARLTIIKEEPGVGVSGAGMVNSIKYSVLRALGVTGEGPIFV